jgi:tetrahydromethanopterin S-methyltransferase subunit G
MKKTAMTLQDSSQQQSGAAFEPVDETEQILERAVLRLNANILGLVLGIIAGLVIFIATNFLILKGGEVVGPHLGLLRAFFPFYSVSFVGSFVGFVWGFLSGYVAGFIIASIYNLVVKLKSR